MGPKALSISLQVARDCQVLRHERPFNVLKGDRASPLLTASLPQVQPRPPTGSVLWPTGLRGFVFSFQHFKM